jgi:predicted nucleic acid-binding protein
MTVAVVDAGPLIHLAEVGRLPLLEVFDDLLLPDAVWNECVPLGRVPDQDLLVLSCIRRKTLSPTEVTKFVEKNALSHLQAGEIECLLLCCQDDIRTLLTDDMAAREAAKRLALTPVGSLGIAIRAYRLGLLTLLEAEMVIANLYDVSSLFVTRTIVEMAIEQLRASASRE